MKREWMLKRNCSLSPRQVGKAHGLLCALALTIGLAFAVRGIWFVFVFAFAFAFAVIEIAAFALALLH